MQEAKGSVLVDEVITVAPMKQCGREVPLVRENVFLLLGFVCIECVFNGGADPEEAFIEI